MTERQDSGRQDKSVTLSTAIFILISSTRYRRAIGTSVLRSVGGEESTPGEISLRAEMATAPAPRKADTSMFTSLSLSLSWLLLLARRLRLVVVVVVFEVARGERRATARTIAPTDLFQLTVLHKSRACARLLLSSNFLFHQQMIEKRRRNKIKQLYNTTDKSRLPLTLCFGN